MVRKEEKAGWKEFFKPTFWKIILFLVSLVIIHIFLIFPYQMCEGGPCLMGFPFRAYYLPGCASSDGFNESCWGFKIDCLSIALDVIIWYLAVCLIFYGYRKILGKNKD